MKAFDWAGRRLKEGSTYAGLGIIALSQMNIQTNNQSANQLIQVLNVVGPIVGGLLTGASTRHP